VEIGLEAKGLKMNAEKTKVIFGCSMRTRNSAIDDKLCDAFRGQSRSPNMVPFHMYDFLSVCYSNMPLFTYSTSKNVVTLKSGSEVTQGH